MEIDELAREYESKSDEELLRLTLDRADLTSEANSAYNADTETEQFSTTTFIVLFWLPLIPSGTFRVQRKRAWFSNDMTALERLPLNWEQVLKVWVVAAGSLFIFIWICRFLPWLFLKFREYLTGRCWYRIRLLAPYRLAGGLPSVPVGMVVTLAPWPAPCAALCAWAAG